MERLTEKNKERLSSKQWRLDHLYKIVDRDGNLITFKENEVQKRFRKEAHTRNLILKSRQHGHTSLACIDGLDDVLFNKNFLFTIIADSRENAVKIFEKIEVAWDNFPLQKIYKVETERAGEMSFSNGSSVRVTTSARSTTSSRLHISEIGTIATKYPKKAKEIIDGSIPAVPRSGRVDIETTAKGGEQGIFYDMCQKATNGTLETFDPENVLAFKFFFFSWLDNPTNTLEGKFTYPNNQLKKYQELHDIPDNRMNFYIQQWKVLKERIKQEFPTYAEEAFSVGSTKLYPREIILELIKEDVKEGEKKGKWRYFEVYIPGHRYGLGADVAEGVGQDSSTIVIIDFSKRIPEVVATYASNTIAPDAFAYEIKNGAEKYGRAVAAPERNNHGISTIDKLKTIYPVRNIYKYIIPGKKKDKGGQRLGWVTGHNTKPKMHFDLKAVIQDKLIFIPDKRILKEALMYNQENLDDIGFDDEATQHFDLLTATAIAYQMKNHLKSNKKVRQYKPDYSKIIR